MSNAYVDPMDGRRFDPGMYEEMLDQAQDISLESQIEDLILKKFGSLKAFCDRFDFNYSTIHNILHRGTIRRASVLMISNMCDCLGIDFDLLAKGIVAPYVSESPDGLWKPQSKDQALPPDSVLTPSELSRLSAAMAHLNTEGRERAVELVEDLAAAGRFKND